MKRVKTNIYRTDSGGFQVKLRGINGRPVSKVFQHLRDADKYLVELKLKKNKGLSVSNDNLKMTVLDLWLEFVEITKVKWSKGWLIDKKALFANHVSSLSNKKVTQIKPKDIQELLLEMDKKGIGWQQKKHVYGLLRQLFEYASEDCEIIDRSPVRRKHIPVKKIVKDNRNYLCKDEVVKLLHYTRSESFGLAVWIGIYLGLRPCEIIALEWADVDFKKNQVNISKNYDKKMKVLNNHTKSGHDKMVPLPSELRRFLLEERSKNLSSKHVMGSKRTKNGLMSYSGFLKALKRYCRNLGIKVITPHGLRHSASSVYVCEGASLLDMQKLLGHKSSKSTEVYMHAGENADKNLAKISNQMQLLSVSVP